MSKKVFSRDGWEVKKTGKKFIIIDAHKREVDSENNFDMSCALLIKYKNSYKAVPLGY